MPPSQAPGPCIAVRHEAFIDFALSQVSPSIMIASSLEPTPSGRWLPRGGGRRLLVTIAAWFVVRLALVPIIDPVLMRGDDAFYVEVARNLIEEGRFGLSARPPGYPIFLAATLWLTPLGVFVAQSCLTLGAAVFTERRLGFSPALAIAAC